MNIYPQTGTRTFPTASLHTDLVVAGGGLAGLCAALAAARDGLQVVLIQDRPVLGGNASSEVRLWANGATSHMGNNNRWAREGGIMGEILEENLWRNTQKEVKPPNFFKLPLFLQWVSLCVPLAHGLWGSILTVKDVKRALHFPLL